MLRLKGISGADAGWQVGHRCSVSCEKKRTSFGGVQTVRPPTDCQKESFIQLDINQN